MAFFTDYLADPFTQRVLVDLTFEHVLLTVIPVAIATLLGLGAGIVAHRAPRLRPGIMNTTSTFLTIPSLALFSLFIPLVGIGYQLAIIPLAMYALLPIVRNTLAGLTGVDAAIAESATGMGMGRTKRLLRIELPIAARGHATLSDLGEIIENDPDQATLCVEPEFSARDDGLPGTEALYGYEFPADNVTVLDTGVVYDATAQRDPRNFGEVFTTDGRIITLDLVILEDDLGFFPLYNASPVFTAEVYAEYGQALDELFAPIAADLDDETMAELNARVSAEGERPAAVAETWLTENGYIG